jgi:Mg2+ and Co2+ transporter CorA
VTAQEQGIELYDILQREMRLDGQVTALEQEMQELHQYVNILEEDKRNEKLDLLTYFAALFVVPGFITGYYGIGEFQMTKYWWVVSLMSAVSAALALVIVRTNNRWRDFWIVVTILFSAFVVFGFPYFVEAFQTPLPS